ncbi:ApaLI family restriction endonuclease [Streptococcus suis]|nr:ApaLI family restriction endonuclease [Streptococcus suis]
MKNEADKVFSTFNVSDYYDRFAPTNLDIKVQERVREMADDNKSHYLIYGVLGISFEEGENIDLYQNIGRFFY